MPKVNTHPLGGGTHNPMSPPFDFLDHAFLPQLMRMGAEIGAILQRPGFYPAGGGSLDVEIKPISKLSALHCLGRGKLIKRSAIAINSKLSNEIADRELKVANQRLGFTGDELMFEKVEASGPGNIFLIVLDFENISEVFVGFGEVGRPAEAVARKACDQAERYLSTDVPVGDYLADQLLLPYAIAGGGSFRCTALSQHFITNCEIIEKFLPIKIITEREARLAWKVSIQSL